MHPDIFENYIGRAKAKYMLNDKAGACKDFQKAIDLGADQSQHFIDTYCK